MLAAFSLSWRRNRLGLARWAASQSSPEDLTSGFPSPEDDARAFGDIHAAHGTGIDIPLVEKAPLEASAAIGGTQEVNIPMHRFRSGAIEREDIATLVSKHLHSTAAASTCFLRPGLPFACK